MSGRKIKRILFCIGMALLTVAFVWGVFITALLISLNSSGDASYAVAVCVAVVMQLIVFRVSRVKLTRFQSWLSCAVGALPVMFLFSRVFTGGGNFKMLGSSFNTTLLIEMAVFAAVTGFYIMLMHFVMPKQQDDEEPEDKPKEQEQPEQSEPKDQAR